MRHRCAVAALLAFLLPVSAVADDAPTQASPSPIFKPGLLYNGTVFANLGGGVRSGTTFSSNFQPHLDVDLERLIGWQDAIAYVDGLWLQGGLPSSFVGDAQGVSSISAPNAVKLYEAWIQKNFVGNHVSLLVGQYDLNSEFYRLQSAGLFVNSSFGIGPEFSQSGVEGPSVFPATSIGMRVGFKNDNGLVTNPIGDLSTLRRGDGCFIRDRSAFGRGVRRSHKDREGHMGLARG